MENGLRNYRKLMTPYDESAYKEKDVVRVDRKMNFLIRLFTKKPKQTTSCYCSKCKNELISSSNFISDAELVTYKCSQCGHVTKWIFDTPVPILIENN